jgi:hypothetical protein
MELTDFIKVEATAPNTRGIVAVRITYTTELQHAIDLLLPASNLEEELAKAEHSNEDKRRVIKLKCDTTKFALLVKLTNDILSRIKDISGEGTYDVNLN